MSYSTPAMIRMALVPSPDGALPSSPTNTAADLADTQLNDAIAEADAIINVYLGGFYTTPVAALDDGTSPTPIGFFSRNIAAYNATLAFREGLDFSESDPIARRYNETMEALKGIAAGSIRLQIPRNDTGTATTGAEPAYNPYVGDLWTPGDFSLAPGNYLPGGVATYDSPYWVGP